MPAYNTHSLTLYCENTDTVLVPYDGSPGRAELVQPGQHVAGEFPTEFINPSMKVCYKMAREAGWKFYKTGRTICPRCNKGGFK